MVQKFLRLILSLSLSLILVGCNSTPRDSRIHINLWQGVNPPTNREVLEKLVAEFNQSQAEVYVDSSYVGQPDQQIPKILAAVVGNAVPDILWYSSTLTGRLVELDAIRPLDDLLGRSPRRDELDPALLTTMQLDNHLWSIPFSTNNIGIFYRPSLFEAAGIKELPRTWDDLRRVAKQLTIDEDKDGRIDRHGIFLPLGKGEFTVFIWSPFLWSAGGDLIKNQQPQLNTPEAVAALQLWQDLVQSNAAILSQPERGYEEDNFISGKVAMQISGSWALRFMTEKKIDFAVMPVPRDKYAATTIGGENLFLFKTSPSREAAAWKFMEYVLSEGFQTEWATQTGYLPVNLKSQRSSAYADYIAKQPNVEIFLNQISAGRARPLTANYPRISESLGRAIEATLLQKSTPTEALANAQRSLDLALNAL